ncbi:MAG: biotin-dependent carboxyltransferase family protein [Parasphingorhabdus sp.]
MSLRVVKAGLQTTLQSAPFRGHRHIGVPAAGAADSLSLALANKLVGNRPNDVALEISLSGAKFCSETTAIIALTGAQCDFRINEKVQSHHRSILISEADEITLGPAQKGCRSYLAISGQVDVDAVMGTRSTYQPAALGGFHGRALQDGDILPLKQLRDESYSDHSTPVQFVPSVTNSMIVRVTVGPEFHRLNQDAQTSLLRTSWDVDQRMSRMGLMLNGKILKTNDCNPMQSGAVFPGVIQCPPSGKPFLLGPDAQTTGGYPRIAQVIKADRHLIGQLRPGSKVQLVKTSPEQAATIYRKKLELLEPWLGNSQLW